MTQIEHFSQFLHQELARKKGYLEVFSSGELKTHRTQGGRLVDTTEDSISRIKLHIEELEGILRSYP